MLCIQELDPFWIYITVSFFKTFFSLSLCVCVKIVSILKKKKKKNLILIFYECVQPIISRNIKYMCAVFLALVIIYLIVKKNFIIIYQINNYIFKIKIKLNFEEYCYPSITLLYKTTKVLKILRVQHTNSPFGWRSGKVRG